MNDNINDNGKQIHNNFNDRLMISKQSMRKNGKVK